MWSDKKKRWLGQREMHRSVVWQEKTSPGSKGKLWECGLTRKTAAWVKGKVAEVWSGGKNRRLGQRGSHRSVVWQGKTAAWVKEEAVGVWSGGKKRWLGQRESCGSVV